MYHIVLYIMFGERQKRKLNNQRK